MTADDLFLDPELVASKRLIKDRPIVGVVSSYGISKFISDVSKLLNFSCCLLDPIWDGMLMRGPLLDLHTADVVWIEDVGSENNSRLLISSLVLCKPVITLDPELADVWNRNLDREGITVASFDPKQTADTIQRLCLRAGQDYRFWLEQTRLSQAATRLVC